MRLLVLAMVMIAGALPVGVGSAEGQSAGAKPAAADLFVAPNGNDGGRCTASSPCRTFNRAYRLAASGAVIEVAGGSYGPQRIDDDPSKGGPDAPNVVFRPSPGTTARIADADILGRNIVFEGTGTNSGFSFQGWTVGSGATDITFRRTSVQIFNILSASHISIIGGQVGPWDSSPAGEDPQIKAQTGTAAPPTDILISGVTFHDITKNAYPDYHTDCLQFGSGQRVVIRNNTFTRCSDTDLFVRSWARGPADNLKDFVIEHNVFNVTTFRDGYFDLQLADSQVDGQFCESFVFRYNVVVGRGLVFNCSPPPMSPGAGLLLGNVLPTVGAWTCNQNSNTGNQPVYSYNVYEDASSATCHPTESVVRPLIVFPKVPSVRVGKKQRLHFTVVARAGSPVKVTVYRGRRAVSTVSSTVSSTPAARTVTLQPPLASRATRFCVTVGTDRARRAGCAPLATS